MWELEIKQDYNAMKFEFEYLEDAAHFVSEFNIATRFNGMTEYVITRKVEEK